jgi:ABC-type transport system involved in multi-copper enzyme maturation permease subunit
MVGPVLYQELMLGARRNRAHIFRWFYAGWILLQLVAVLLTVSASRPIMGPGPYGARRPFDYTDFAEFARTYLNLLVWQHYLVMLLSIPVLTAGAITDEKWRGTLQYLLVTELYSWEILVGKLIGRLYQVLLIAVVPLPLICFLGVFGGLDLSMLGALIVSSVVMGFALASMSLLASVLCRHTRDAVLGLYTTVGVAYLLCRLAVALLRNYLAGHVSVWLNRLEALLSCFDPLHPMGAGWSLDDPGERGGRVLASALAWGSLGLVCLVLATLRLRASYLRYLEHTTKHSWWPVLFVYVSVSTLVGLAVLLPYLLVTGNHHPYLDGTSRTPWWAALLMFLLIWNGVCLLPFIGLRIFLAINGSSSRFLDGMHGLMQRSWLLGRAPVHGDPLRWKERHVEGVAPLASLRNMPRWLGVVLVLVATSASGLTILARHLPVSHTPGAVIKLALEGDLRGLRNVQVAMDRSDWDFFWQGLSVMLLAGLVMAVRCSGAVTGEREKNTWEALLLTPLETRHLIRSKLWGIVGASWPYLVAYLIPALAFSSLGGTACVLFTLLWFGVTWLAMFFVGGAGLWCSVRSKNSWRSLLSTLGISYIGGFILFCIIFVPSCILSCLIMMVLAIIDQLLVRTFGVQPSFTAGGMGGLGVAYDGFGIAVCILLALSFAIIAWRFIVSAEYRVSVLERTKHWRNEPRHPRWSRYGRERRAEGLR